MPDEPIQNELVEAEAVAEAEEIVATPSEELEQAQLEETIALNSDYGDDDDGEEDEDEEPPAPPAPPTAEKPEPTLADVVKDNPKLAKELADLTAQREFAAARQAEANARLQAEQNTLNQQWNTSVEARNKQLSVRQQEDYQLYYEGENDVIGAQEKRRAAMERRAAEDNWWVENDKWFRDRTQVSQAALQARSAEQQAISRQVDQFAKTKTAQAIQQALSGKRYPGSFDEGFSQYLGDIYEQAVLYGRQIERDESTAKAKAAREARQASARQGLQQETPDVVLGGNRGPRLPSTTEIDGWSYEKKQEELKKDPYLYDKVAAAEMAGGRRR